MENIGYDGLVGLDGISDQDKIVILYSEIFERKLPEIVGKYNIKAELEMKKVSTGYKDALDFKLLAYGLLLYQAGQKELIFVSRDKGYLSLKDAIIELGIPINIRIGFAPDLKIIPIIYDFENGICTRYEIQHENLLEYKDGVFKPINKIVYKKMDSAKYICTKKKEKEFVETSEMAYEDFIDKHGLVTEEMEKTYENIKAVNSETKITAEIVETFENQVQVSNKPIFTKSEKKQIVQQRWCSLMLEVSEWAEEHNKGTTVVNAINRMATRHIMSRQEFMQVMGSLFHEKVTVLNNSVGKIYDRHMQVGRKGKKK